VAKKKSELSSPKTSANEIAVLEAFFAFFAAAHPNKFPTRFEAATEIPKGITYVVCAEVRIID
jgi:hypothetical protein